MSGLFDQKTESDLLYQRKDTYGRGLGILSGIQVSLDSPEPDKFQADAVTKGDSIFLSTGAEGLLRHELGHVIQQRRGNVPATKYVAGQKLNDSAAMEREADRLGSLIPQHMVKGVLSDAGQGRLVQSVKGVVQCSGKPKKKSGTSQRVGATTNQRIVQGEKEVNDLIARWRDCMTELNNIRGQRRTKKTQDKIVEIQEMISNYKIRLVQLLNGYYQGHNELIVSLVNQIEQGNYNPITSPLSGHLYGARSILPPHKQELTGLHAYSDAPVLRRQSPSGTLPQEIKSLGYIGDRSQVHILHWTLEGEQNPKNSKFSTMLPNTMPEVISKLLFGAASRNAHGTKFGEICMGGSGDTMFPVGDDILITRDLPEGDPSRYISCGEVLGESDGNADRPITLTDIYRAFNPDENGDKVFIESDRLEVLGVYHPLSGM